MGALPPLVTSRATLLVCRCAVRAGRIVFSAPERRVTGRPAVRVRPAHLAARVASSFDKRRPRRPAADTYTDRKFPLV